MTDHDEPATRPYVVGDYLMDRLAELGVRHMFGVPGDYSLSLLDSVVAHPDVDWVGCSNELNAGYAADGYARMRGLGALCTTFGVGELSAINAITGSFAEFVPVIHVVGAPSTAAQSAHKMVHHTLGDGLFDHFARMHGDITCAQGVVTAQNASQEIDRVLSTARTQRLPGYLLLPVDVAVAPVAPPAAPLRDPVAVTDPDALAAFTRDAAELLTQEGPAQAATALVGVLPHRLGAVDEVRQLLAAAPLPHATTLWAKSIVDEGAPTFVGTYAGVGSDEPTRRAVEDAAALLVLGVEFTDLNTGLFTHHLTRARTIEIGPRTASVGHATFGPIELRDAVAALVPLVAGLPRATAPGARPVPAADGRPAGSEPLTQELLWPEIASHLRDGDIVVADQGTSFYGMGPQRLASGVTFVGQPLWASIGYTLPALLGACLAEPGRRGVLLIGDGAAQMTIQELGTILREGLSPVVVVVDNDGYTVERVIHGPNQPYNDIARWDWALAPAFFGPDHAAEVHVARTLGDLRSALAGAAESGRLTLIRAMLPRTDAPALLETLGRQLAKANARR